MEREERGGERIRQQEKERKEGEKVKKEGLINSCL